MKTTLVALMGAGLALVGGCATIIVGQSQSISIQSAPDGAEVSVFNRAGEKVHSGVAPMTVSLKRGAGYFRAEHYTLRFSKAGYAPRTVELEARVNGWYIGNIVFGGLLGMLAIDPATGAMYTLPEKTQGNLDAVPTADAGGEARLKVVSADTLAPAQLALARVVVPGH